MTIVPDATGLVGSETKRRSLFVRLAMGFILSVLITMILAASLSGILLRRAERPLALYRRHIVQLSSILLRELGDLSASAIGRFESENPDIDVAVYRGERKMAGTIDLPEAPESFFRPGMRLDDATLFRTWQGTEYTMTRKDDVIVVFGYRLHLLVPLAQRLLVLLLVAIIIGFLLLYFYIRRLLAPISKLQAATLEVSQGRLGHRITEQASSEFEQLFSAFNAMAERLQALFANDVLLLGNLSHDLKFYLTRLKLTAEVDVADPVTRNSLQEDIDALNRYLDRVLMAFRAGSRQARYQLATIDLSVWLEARRAEWPGVDCTISKGICAGVDAEAWRTIVDNLLDNARKYGKEIRIELSGGADRFWFRVINRTELALSSDQLGLLLQPFYRGDAARTAPGAGPGTRGTGLGLFIVKATAEGMNLDFVLTLDQGIFTACLSGPTCCRPDVGGLVAGPEGMAVD